MKTDITSRGQWWQQLAAMHFGPNENVVEACYAHYRKLSQSQQMHPLILWHKTFGRQIMYQMNNKKLVYFSPPLSNNKKVRLIMRIV